jgi:hypothetical protein
MQRLHDQHLRRARLARKRSAPSVEVLVWSSGSWWPGPSCFRKPGGGSILKRPVPSADGEDALSELFLWSGGAGVFAAVSSRAF